jgi:hypothetical protein
MHWDLERIHKEESSLCGPADGAVITGDGFSIKSERDGETSVEYDRSKFRIERDPSSTEQIERFKFVRK